MVAIEVHSVSTSRLAPRLVKFAKYAVFTMAFAITACGADEPGAIVGTAPAFPEEMIDTDADPTELINFWRVIAPDVTDTWLQMDMLEYSVWGPCHFDGSWRAADNMFLAGAPWGMVGNCPDIEWPWHMPWLENAYWFEAIDTGIRLLDINGDQLAILVDDGTLPPENPNIWDGRRVVPVVTEEAHLAFTEPAPLPQGFAPVNPADLLGRWAPPLTGDARPFPNTFGPFVEFASDGTWASSDGCNSSGGAWRLGPGGRLLATAGITTLVDCGTHGAGWTTGGSRVGQPADCALLFDAPVTDCFAIFDSSGELIGRLSR